MFGKALAQALIVALQHIDRLQRLGCAAGLGFFAVIFCAFACTFEDIVFKELQLAKLLAASTIHIYRYCLFFNIVGKLS